jgi:hypothetical protein
MVDSLVDGLKNSAQKMRSAETPLWQLVLMKNQWCLIQWFLIMPVQKSHGSHPDNPPQYGTNISRRVLPKVNHVHSSGA